jgi:hypothetical protein
MADNLCVTFRELFIILFIVGVGATYLWWETGRNEAVLSAAAIMLGIFAAAGAVAVVTS